jgi:threonine dehydrogenase-like Zn-dependent dehydrogenase
VPEVEAEVHKPVCDAIMDGKIDIDLFVTHRFSIDDYEKGFQAVKDRTALKVVLNF